MMTRSCCASLACVVAVAAIRPALARADAVLDWNIHASQAIVTIGGQSPPRSFIRLAMVHLAIYDAVNAIEGQPFVSYASKPFVNLPASADAAVAAAAHDVLVALFPSQSADLIRTRRLSTACRTIRRERTESRSASRPRLPSSSLEPTTAVMRP